MGHNHVHYWFPSYLSERNHMITSYDSKTKWAFSSTSIMPFLSVLSINIHVYLHVHTHTHLCNGSIFPHGKPLTSNLSDSRCVRDQSVFIALSETPRLYYKP